VGGDGRIRLRLRLRRDRSSIEHRVSDGHETDAALHIVCPNAILGSGAKNNVKGGAFLTEAEGAMRHLS
jgi:hypothetical protein